jgi:hypothetical protein
MCRRSHIIGGPLLGGQVNLSLNAKGGVACGTVLVGGQAMATELKVIRDAAVAGQEALGVAG